ncbi:UDP-N-acetylglucosamine 1-carboxyvinyltransferase [Candidatus Parcubacteria bacterium]|nr:MAG: UDP-N-acetylglucosamine 1-carboxyvinyltransferase [Candidatus Parcubacteria bacterium]
MTSKEKIGAFIAALREERGITQAQLAKALHTSQSAVARMEKGEQNFTTETLAKLSKALGKSIVTLSPQTLNLRIEGGKKLHGSIVVNRAKNSAVFLLCAALLNKQKTILKEMPRIEEVNRISEVLTSIGAKVTRKANNDIEIVPPKKLRIRSLHKEAAKKTRSMLLLIPALLQSLPAFSFPHPGGCKLGKRTIRPHLFALEKFGITITTTSNAYTIKRKKLRAAEIVLYESGDTATGNAIMTAACIPGTTVIKYASANYQVQDLCRFLTLLGVAIEGIGTTTLTIHGKEQLSKEICFFPSEDPIEAMLFLSIAATTRSKITIRKCPIDFLELELLKLEKMGFRYRTSRPYYSKNGFTKLVDITTFPSRLKALEEKIYGRPFPGLNIDNLPFFVPIATQAEGTTLIHDWVYENRAVYYLELAKLGARVILADPHRVYIEGPVRLKPAEVVCPPALRPAAIILIAMLAAKGISVLRNIYSINRGYEDLAKRLSRLGASVQLIQE